MWPQMGSDQRGSLGGGFWGLPPEGLPGHDRDCEDGLPAPPPILRTAEGEEAWDSGPRAEAMLAAAGLTAGEEEAAGAS